LIFALITKKLTRDIITRQSKNLYLVAYI